MSSNVTFPLLGLIGAYSLQQQCAEQRGGAGQALVLRPHLQGRLRQPDGRAGAGRGLPGQGLGIKCESYY